jgi:hypothetical protein
MSPVTDAAAWDALFQRVEHAHMVQSWPYGEAKVATGEWHVRRLVFEQANRPVAICQVLDKSAVGVRYASRINRGPLFLDTHPEHTVVEGVYRAIRRRWRCLCGGLLVLAPALLADETNRHMMREIGFRDRHHAGWHSARVDLQADEAQLRGRLKHEWRNRLRMAEGSGLEISVSRSAEGMEWMIARHVENMRDKGFVGPAPALLMGLWRAARDDCFLFRAHLAGEAVGGMLVYRFGRSAECYVGWFGEQGRKVNAGNFTYWYSLLEMQRQGCRWFDLGGVSSSGGYGQFKRGIRGGEYDLLHEWVAL